MILHNLIIAVRNILKYKTQNFVSLIGLAIGLAAFSLAGMWLKYELTYDIHWPESERTYVMLGKSKYETRYSEYTPIPLAEYMKRQIPEVEEACCLDFSYIYVEGSLTGVTCVDSILLAMFPIHIIDGSPDFYRYEKQYALSESMAMKMFGTLDIIGKKLKEGGETKGIVTTIFEDPEGHSNFKWQILGGHLPFIPYTYQDSQGVTHTTSPWNSRTVSTLIRFHKNADIGKAIKKLNEALSKEEEKGQNDDYNCIRLTEFKYREGQFYDVRMEHVRIFCLIGGLIVLAALLNHLILYTIRIRIRMREMILRKVHGASGASLTITLLTELFVLLVMAYLVGMMILELMLPAFRELSGIKESLSFFYGEGTLFMMLILLLSVFISWIILHVQCQHSLQAGLRKSHTFLMRKIGLVLQLVISIVFMFCSVVMTKQLHHLIHSSDTGFTNSQIGFVNNAINGVGPTEYQEFYQHMKQLPYIKPHAIHDLPFNGGIGMTIFQWTDMQEGATPINTYKGYINQDIYELFGLQLLAGSVTDTYDSVIINESAAKALGWQTEEVPGKFINNLPVAGVIKDLHLHPIEPVFPTIYFTAPKEGAIRSIVFTYEEEFEDVYKKLKEHFDKVMPNVHFAASTPAIWIKEKLESERALLKLLIIASIVSVLISLFGIFSMVNLSCEYRRKEMALRKIHGAKVKDIAGLFAKEYGFILILSTIVAFPIGYAIMKPEMETYVIQTNISIWIYLSIFGIIVILTLLCVGFRIWRTANENPADVVKSE